jgi:hypothetical protein
MSRTSTVRDFFAPRSSPTKQENPAKAKLRNRKPTLALQHENDAGQKRTQKTKVLSRGSVDPEQGSQVDTIDEDTTQSNTGFHLIYLLADTTL